MSQETSTRWNPWPVSIIAFFTVAIIGCVSFVAFCSRHPADLVTASYYEEEVQYQGRINRVAHTRQQASAASVRYDAARQLITVTLPPGQVTSNLNGNIQLYRPSAMSLDRELKLEPNPQGVQTVDAQALQSGLWRVRVSWSADQQDYYIDQKVVVVAKAS
jgi:YD repeat-containing protein